MRASEHHGTHIWAQEDLWFGIESFFIANFSVEFLLRVLTTPSCKEFWSQVTGLATRCTLC